MKIENAEKHNIVNKNKRHKQHQRLIVLWEPIASPFCCGNMWLAHSSRLMN